MEEMHGYKPDIGKMETRLQYELRRGAPGYKPDIGKMETLYRLYEQTKRELALPDSETACQKGCADCCTCNVTMTGLEASYLVRSLDGTGRRQVAKRILENFPEKRYQPAMTFNGFAACCVAGGDVPEEENDPSWGNCPLLVDGLCTVYPFRPFGCRSMVSKGVCGQTGYADMPPLVLTLNNIFCQYIEHLDCPGWYGNLSDMLLRALRTDSADFVFENRTISGKTGTIMKNMRIRVLLVPPEHRSKVTPLLRRLAALE